MKITTRSFRERYITLKDLNIYIKIDNVLASNNRI